MVLENQIATLSSTNCLYVTVGCNDKVVEITCLITLNIMREQRELNGVPLWIALPIYTQMLFVYVYA